MSAEKSFANTVGKEKIARNHNYTPVNEVCGGILESACQLVRRAVGQLVCLQNLVRTTPPTVSAQFAVYLAEVFIRSLLQTLWEKKKLLATIIIPPRTKCVRGILESACQAVSQWVCPQNLLRTTPPTVSVQFAVNLAEVFIRSCRCARHTFC